jgi:hypothetical protein
MNFKHYKYSLVGCLTGFMIFCSIIINYYHMVVSVIYLGTLLYLLMGIIIIFGIGITLIKTKELKECKL